VPVDSREWSTGWKPPGSPAGQADRWCGRMADRKRSTSTSAFGVGRRESHDATAFYSRFEMPAITDGDVVAQPTVVDKIITGDARDMREVASGSVALVVTSPPYFAGKAYEEELGEGHIPASYLEYLEMLYEVFRECVDKLEDGGRIAVNVANLGRRPYRSLSADVIDILQNRLHLLLRGEIIWQKARGAGGSCAWGSFQSPMNPVLRDLTERVIVASKGRFDRARTRAQRVKSDQPADITIFKDEFMEATTDVWDIPPESATRVNHPAPFPVELPQRLIDLYTFKGDLVLDPFMGSGTTAVAAVRTDRHYVGYDMEDQYVKAAEKRVAGEHERLALLDADGVLSLRANLPATKVAPSNDMVTASIQEGRASRELAEDVLTACGFTNIKRDHKVGAGMDVSFKATDRSGKPWLFELVGGYNTARAGLRRSDALWKVLGKAAVVHAQAPDTPLVILTTALPSKNSPADLALRALQPSTIRDIVELHRVEDADRLRDAASSSAKEPVRPKKKAAVTMSSRAASAKAKKPATTRKVSTTAKVSTAKRRVAAASKPRQRSSR
jgi:DNA modification methylase